MRFPLLRAYILDEIPYCTHDRPPTQTTTTSVLEFQPLVSCRRLLCPFLRLPLIAYLRLITPTAMVLPSFEHLRLL